MALVERFLVLVDTLGFAGPGADSVTGIARGARVGTDGPEGASSFGGPLADGGGGGLAVRLDLARLTFDLGTGAGGDVWDAGATVDAAGDGVGTRGDCGSGDSAAGVADTSEGESA